MIGESGGSYGVTKTGAGDLSLGVTNTFTGTTSIDNGSIIVNNALALQSSTVSINVNDGLDVTTNLINATIGALTGSGDLTLGSQNLRTGGNGDSTIYSGVITGDNNSILRHNGAGTLTLTGGDGVTPSDLGVIRSISGVVVFDGAHVDLTSNSLQPGGQALLATAGDVTLQNGTVVQITGISSGSVRDGTLLVTGNTTSLTGGRFTVAPGSTHTGSAVLEQGASVDLAEELEVGSDGNGSVTVQSGAMVNANTVILASDPNSFGESLVTGQSLLSAVNSLLK